MTATVHLEEITYSPDSCALFERLRTLPCAAFLDSSVPHATTGRFDILTADPGDEQPALPARIADEASGEQLFAALADFHRRYYAGIRRAAPDIPFCGGVLGVIGYDVGAALHGIAPPTGAPVPTLQLLAYDWCVIQDHLLRRSALVWLPQADPRRLCDVRARLRGASPAISAFRLRAPFQALTDKAAYRAAFARAQHYINAGDCYQVNLAQSFSAPYSGDPWHAYQVLRAQAAAPYAAYLDLAEGGALLSLSPERFLSLHGQHVETSPIKGTRPRHGDAQADRAAAVELQASPKDRAENLMIVDLLRNDLGRNCVPGSIRVDRLFEVRSFPAVHHLVSTVSGELAAACSPWQLLRDCFPGGSITGAPKRRAMQIIAELEPVPRRAYCGSVVYVSADGQMNSNIAIRSLLCDGTTVRCWGGGGIVADSRSDAEYQECLDKIGALLASLEQISTA